METRIRVTDDVTGLELDMVHCSIEDGCHRCEATGRVSFSTEEDLKKYEEDVDAMSESRDDYYDLMDYGPARNGVKNCEHCAGTGKVKGAGPLHFVRMELAPALNFFPLLTNGGDA